MPRGVSSCGRIGSGASATSVAGGVCCSAGAGDGAVCCSVGEARDAGCDEGWAICGAGETDCVAAGACPEGAASCVPGCARDCALTTCGANENVKRETSAIAEAFAARVRSLRGILLLLLGRFRGSFMLASSILMRCSGLVARDKRMHRHSKVGLASVFFESNRETA